VLLNDWIVFSEASLETTVARLRGSGAEGGDDE
jgi:hypothetical protein